MTRRMLIALLLALVVGGLVAYSLQSRAPEAPQVTAEDCEDKPPPNEFAMAAECEGEDPGTGAAPDGAAEGGGSR